MKIQTLKERMEKLQTKINKKHGTIEKKQKSVLKKSSMLFQKYGVTYNEQIRLTTDKFKQLGLSKEEAWDAYWLQCDIDSLMDDLERLPKEISEMQKTMEKYEGQLAGEIEKESMFITEVPEILKQMEVQLVAEWDRWDHERQERLQKKYDEVGYTAFFKGTPAHHFWDKHTYADYEFMHESMESIHNDNVKFARQEVLDLFIRVKDVTGEITDWSGITCKQGNTFPVLTGVVVGKEGKASVETVLAGGYNIQRLHIRILVHSL